MEIGEKRNHLVLLEDLGMRQGRHYGKFKCDCGNIKDIRIDYVTSGNNKACGCMRYIKHSKGNTKHNVSHTRIYDIHQKMIARCYKENVSNYSEYGGRGIRVCDEWREDVKAFYDWSMANGYSDNLSIDRIDNNGNYEPSNCRWATAEQQSNNRRNNVLITLNGETQTLAQWCKHFNIPYARAQMRMYRGWKDEDLFK